MGYFPNSSSGECYVAEYCSRCIHGKNDSEMCAVMLAHIIFNYDECNNKGSILHLLIPRSKDGGNDQCAMFVETE